MYIMIKTIMTLRAELKQQPIPEKHQGIILRILSRMFRLIDRPYKMYFLGFLFGFGFDTSTEVALLGLASLEAINGSSIYLIMIYPALFTAGMMLVDTIDGAAMYLAYTSNFARQNRVVQSCYSIILTGMSVVVASTIGIIQMLTLIMDTAEPRGNFWNGVAWAGDHYPLIGAIIIGCFAFVVICSAIILRLFKDRLDQFSVPSTSPPDIITEEQSAKNNIVIIREV